MQRVQQVSEVFGQIHARVQLADLRFVTVEHLGFDFFGKQAALADAPLGGLAPARVVYRGVHIGIKTVFMGGGFVPRGEWLFFGETNLHDALAALKTVFPRHGDTLGCAVLVWQYLAIHAKGQEGQGMHGFIHAQAFGIGPAQHPRAHIRHGFGVGQGDEFHELGAAQWLDFFDEF